MIGELEALCYWREGSPELCNGLFDYLEDVERYCEEVDVLREASSTTTTMTTHAAVQDGCLLGSQYWDDTGPFLGALFSYSTWIGLVVDLGQAPAPEHWPKAAQTEPVLTGLRITFGSPTAPQFLASAVYFVPELDPQNFGAGSLRPGYRNERILTAGVQMDPEGISISAGPSDGTRPDILPVTPNSAWDPNLNRGAYVINPDDRGDLVGNWQHFQGLIQDPKWNGRVALTIYGLVPGNTGVGWPSNENPSFSGPVVTATYTSTHPGASGLNKSNK
jgi:hypothetical protein